MKARVKINDKGEPYRLIVEEHNGHSASFAVTDGVATAQSITPINGEESAYLEDLTRFMEFAETIPCIDRTRLDKSTCGEDRP